MANVILLARSHLDAAHRRPRPRGVLDGAGLPAAHIAKSGANSLSIRRRHCMDLTLVTG